MNEEVIADLIGLGATLATLLVAFVTGTIIERRHFKDIEKRERRSRNMVVVTFAHPPPDWQIVDAALVTGSVVVSLDYFKRFLAALRAIFGGRIKAYEPLLDRARREALLRMKEEAFAYGFNSVLNVRYDTSRLASTRADGKGTAGIEVLAFGTAVKVAS